MNTVASPASDFATASRQRTGLVMCLEHILIETPHAPVGGERALAAVRNQVRRGMDWVSLCGMLDADSDDLGTGSSRELAYTIKRIAALLEANPSPEAFAEIRVVVFRALAAQRSA